MKFAKFDGNRIEALKGAQGICPGCGAELVAKCGEIKLHHWAHKGNRNCDPWWEPETEWHRSWKNSFPIECQENILYDEQTGEKHIADIRTTHDLVIEFQHSHIHPDEHRQREKFYKHMIWVVDCTRLKGDYPRFLKGKTDFRLTDEQGRFFVDYLDGCFPSAWIGSSVPVIFDFKGTEIIDDPNDIRNHLYVLFPASNRRESDLFVISRASFISNTIHDKWFKKQQEPPKQIANAPIINNIQSGRRESPYVSDRGKIIKRRRL